MEEIYAYIEKDSAANAAKWADRLMRKIEGIKDFPKAGRVLPELDSVSIREIVFGNYRIVYKVREETAFILTVRHFKQILPLKDLEE
ncbi:MAG: type II toxin-antitoxin system RelE/ParE family toxin [Fibrobacteres bacterium]|nr:type II toxin-antitoxin system RelE/ParE family toxin [Fibrobacterota bacterium]